MTDKIINNTTSATDTASIADTISKVKVTRSRSLKISESELNRQIGENVRLLRLKRKMTLRMLARSLGISLQQLSKCEKGENKISAGRLFTISEVLGVDIATMYKDQTIPGEDSIYLKLFEKVQQ